MKSVPPEATDRGDSPGQVSREALYDEVWRQPMLRVAERYRVSSSFMARVCDSMNVPRPPRGHWAKLEHGKPSPQAPLPDARPGDRLVWRRGDAPGPVRYPLPKPPERQVVHPRPRISRSARHPLVSGVRDLFTKGKVIDSGYLKPSQRRLVDVVVSEPMLDDALDTANALFLRLEATGYRVMLAPGDRTYSRASVDERETPGKTANKRYPSLWHPSRATVVFVGSVAIGLTLFEMTEQLEARYVDGEYIPLARFPVAERRRPLPSWSWTTQMPFASGRLCLQAFSPYPVADWVHSWPEAKARALRGQVDEIVDYLTKAAATIAGLVEEGERQAEIRRLEWEEERRRLEERWERERQEKARAAARQDLLEAIRAWDDIRRIQAFFREAEGEALSRTSEERGVLLGRLAMARELVGELDALDMLMKWRGPEER
ncbi:hypothetical protein VST52_01630 [Pseudomonas aeruginosa]|uniref:hypothetical protein n=1 Tax=Pseudomonas aeruginosa TaxID=287 RepID=UPI003982B5B2